MYSIHKLYMINKRVLMKIDDGEWQFWADIVWLNCLVVFLHSTCNINEHKKSSQARI